MMKILKGIISVIKYIVEIIVVFIVAIIVVQRVSNNEMSVAGFRIFTVVTESMVPKYVVGDVLLVKHVEPSEIKKEDDVTYMGKVGSFADKVVTHQVIDIQKAENGTLNFITKGIANDKEDPTINESQIYGVVQGKLEIVTKLNGIINNSYGMYFLIVIPLAIIVFSELKAYKEDAKYKENDDEEDDEQHDDDKEDNEEDETIDKRMKKRKERRAKRRKRYE